MKKLYAKKSFATNNHIKLIVLAVFLFTTVFSGYSQVRVPFAPRASVNTPTQTIYTVKGDFNMIGNTNLTLVNYGDNTNNFGDMEYVDVDNDSSTLNSSSATLDFSTENSAIPECSRILYAGLYWTGRAGDALTYTINGIELNKRKVLLKTPNSGSYIEITANNNDIYYPSGTDGNMYSAYADITNEIDQNDFLGDYFVANITTLEGDGGSIGYYGGWGLVVVYENDKMNWRDITVFDGHAYVPSSVTSYDINVTGFNAVQNGDVNVKLGVMAGEGDVAVTGDYFQIQRQDNGNFQSLSHSSNSSNNFFNSSINTGGNNRNPQLANNTGVDIAMFNIDNTGNGIIDNGDTSTTLRYGSTQDTYIIFNVTFAVDAYIPEAEALVTVSSINNGPPTILELLPGESADYKIEITNNGTEPLNNTLIIIPVPFTSNYEDLSISSNIFSPLTLTNSNPIYDPNLGPTGSIVWDIGTLPVSTNTNDVLAELSFTLTASTDCSVLVDTATCDSSIKLGGSISGVGSISGTTFNQDLISGYQSTGNCIGEPITDPTTVLINADDYINANCGSYTAVRDFYYCNIGNTPIQTSDIESAFPTGSTFYNEYPLTGSSIEFDSTNPFPANSGTTVYYALAPNNSLCYYEFTINVSNNLPEVTYNQNNVLCFGESTGSINVSVSGGIPPYSYAWTGPNSFTASTEDITDLAAGTYVLTVTDAFNCNPSLETTVTITEPALQACDIQVAGCPPLINTECAETDAGSNVTWTPPQFTYECCAAVTGDDYSFYVEFDLPETGNLCWSYNGVQRIGNNNLRLFQSNGSSSFVLAPLQYFDNTSGTPINVEFIVPSGVFDWKLEVLDGTTVVYTNTIVGISATGLQTITIPNTVPNGAYNLRYTFDDNGTGLGANDHIEVDRIFYNATLLNADCTGGLNFAVTSTHNPGDLFAPGDTTVTYTATYTPTTGDPVVLTCDFDVTVVKIDLSETVAEHKDVTCPSGVDGSITVSASGGTGPYTYSLDNVDFSNTTGVFEDLSAGNYTVYAKDANGCTDPSPLSVTLIELNTEDPTITAPSTITIEGCDETSLSNTNDARYPYSETQSIDIKDTYVSPGYTASDGDGDDTIANITYIDVITPDSSCPTIVTRTFTIEDICGNTATAVQTITVTDTTAPVAPTAPADITYECIADVPAAGDLTAVDNCAGDITVTGTDSIDNTNPCNVIITRTWTFTDNCSNSSSVSQTITVTDTTAPVAPTAPADITYECIADVPAAGDLTAVDNCAGDITVTGTDSIDNTNPCNVIITRTWTFTDNCSNSSSVSQTITVTDTTAPVAPTAPADITYECIADVPAAGDLTAVDNCAGDITVTGTDSIDNTNPCNVIITRTWTFTDNCSNSSSVSQTITVTDTTAPVAPTAPADITYECIADVPAAGDLTAVDNCAGDITVTGTDSIDNTNPCNVIITRTWTFTDNCSNSSSVSQTITVTDTTAPVAPTAPADITYECIADVPAAGDLTAVDNCAGDITVTGTDSIDNTNPCNVIITRTWTFTDNCSNSSSVSQTITVTDTTAPVAPTAPADITYECIADVPVAGDLTAVDNCAGDITVTGTDSIDNTNPCNVIITRTWTFTDNCSNSSSVSQTITVTDTTAPVAPTAPADITYECIADVPAAGDLTAVDNCAGDITVTGTDSIDNTNPCNVIITRTWTFTDNCSNSSSVSQTITVTDTTAPVAPTAPADITYECIADVPAAGDLTAVDNCAGDITVTGTDSIDNTNPCNVIITRTWTFTDNCSNSSSVSQTITVTDTTAPVITCPANITVTADPGQPNANITIPLPSVSDNCDTNVTYTNDYTLAENASGIYNLGTTTVTYTATDSCGNTTQCSFTVTVNDEEAPQINCPPTITVSCIDLVPTAYSNYTEFEAAGGSATDNNGIDQATFALVSETSDNNSCPETISRVYTISDTDGNSSECTQLIIVNDEITPVAPTAPADITYECIADVPAAGDLTAVDNCAGDITVTGTDSIDNTNPCNVIITRTWTFTDNCSNSSSVSQTITVTDTTAPVAPTAPADITYECIADVPAAGDLTAVDNCAGDITVTGTDSIDNTNPCNVIITRTWTFTDNCSNSSSVSQTITVTDTTAPVAPTAPADITYECIADVPAAGDLTAVDNCAGDITVTGTDSIDNTNPCNVIITRTWTFTDNCSNSSSVSQTITVTDTTAPVAPTAPADITYECIADVPAAGDLTAVDNCAGDITVTGTDSIDNTNPCNVIITRTWTFTDNCSNSSSVSQTITVTDTTAPVAPTAPADITYECIADVPAAGDLTAVDNCAGDITVTGTDSIDNTNPCNVIITRTWTFTDNCSNSSSVSQTITVTDTTAPVITCPANITVTADPGQPNANITIPLPSVSDNCDTNVTYTNDYTLAENASGIYNLGTTTVTYTATDSCGNTTQCSFTVTVNDEEAPQINCPPTITVSCIDLVPTAYSNYTEFEAAGGSATDNNGIDQATFALVSETSDNNSCPETISRVYTISDTDGNSSECTQLIIVNDEIAPVAPTAPADITYECIADVPAAGDLTAVDNCAGDITVTGTDSIDNTNPCNVIITRTWTFTDNCSNSSSVSQTITVTDTTAPVAPTAPADITYECIADVPAAGDLTAVDNCAGDITVTGTDSIDNTNPCNVIITRTWTFTDNCSNSSSVSQTITVTDTTAPVAPTAPADITYECIADVPAAGDLTAVDNCAGDITVTGTDSIDNTNPCNVIITRTWTFTDNCSNSSSVSQTITVTDTTAPVAPTAPADITYECIADVPAAGDLTAVDNCAGDITVTGTDSIDNTNPCNVIITRTWTFTDNCSNSSSVSQTITVTDTTAPVAPTAPADITYECIADVPAAGDLTAVDNCAGDITVTGTDSIDNTNPCNVIITRTWTFTDNCSNSSSVSQTITVTDTTAPVITCPANITVTADPGQPNANITIPLPSVSDNCDTNVTYTNDYTLAENASGIYNLGTTTVTYTATDSCGNTTQCSFTVTVNDEEAPQINCPPTITVSCIDLVPTAYSNYTEFEAAGGSATDNNGIDQATFALVSETSDNNSCPETISRVYTISDTDGNSSECTQLIIVNDEITPVAPTAPADITYECIADVPAAGDLTAVDNCAGDITVTGTDSIDNTNPCNVIITRTWTFTDNCSNSSSVSQTITVTDTTAPVAPTAPADITYECIADVPAAGDLTAVDNCAGDITVTGTDSIDNTNPCNVIITRTWTFTDNCSNSSSVSQTITVTPSTPPVVPANATSTIECIADAIQPVAPVVTDVCGNDITPVITENDNPICEGDKVYTFTYTDCAGNSSVYTYTYNIEVTTVPVVPANATSTVDCIADAIQPVAPVVTDVCGNDITPVITENDDPICEGDKVYTFTYTDCAGNSSVYTYTYNIEVTTVPVVPANATSTVECIADAIQPAAPVVTDVCGNDITPVITENDDPICEGDKVYTFTYTDCAGNSSVYTYTYNIDLTQFILPANGLETVDNLADAVEPTPPTVTDNCGNPITPVLSDVSNTPDCQGSIVYTFTYTDCAGNSADWTYTYTVILAPFTVPADEASTVECIADAVVPTPPTVFDANGNEVIPVMTENDDPVCEGDKVYTFTYTDCAGNTGEWIYTYTIDITTVPVVPANATSTVECIADAIQPVAPVVTDVCGNDITPVITENDDPICEGDKVYTFTYTDCAGNSSVYTYTYNIEVTTAPVVPANATSTVECIADAIQPVAPVVTDVCGNDITPVITENDDPICEGDKVYTFTYTDCAGNSSVYTYTYNIEVTTAPVVPANATSTVECIADAIQPAAPVVTDVCGNDITPVITENDDPICEGDKVYTFTYTDCAGNSSVYTYTYNIDLTQFILPANGLETVDNLADAVEPTPPTVTDNCGNPITPVLSDVSNTPDCQGSIVYTFTYTDCAGNSADWTYTYTVILAPFTVPADEASTVECIADAVVPTPPTVFDANGNEVIPVMTENDDPVCEGDKVYTFTYTDCAGNTGEWIYTYTIDITTVPVVPANATSTVECIADAIQPVAPVVTDVCGNDITPVITENDDPICEGDKVYTFTYTDCAGNSSVYTYTYNIEVTTVPVVPANATSTIECIADAIQPVAPVVTDVCGNDITPVITENDDPICEGDKVYTFTYTDCAGNSSVYTYTYNIEVTTVPVVPANATSTVECIADAIQPAAPVVTDVCGNDITPVITENDDPICEGDKVYTFTYTDCAGNSSVYTYTYNIDLTQFILPANGLETVDNLADAVEPTPPTVTDNCGNPITPVLSDVSNTPDCQGSIVYTFTYTDCAGNSADWTYTYTVILAPFTVPADEASTVECIADAVVPAPPTVFDANGNEVIPVMTENDDPVCEGDKVYTFTYTDCAGNTGEWIYTYTVRDDIAPVAPNAPANITFECIDDVPVAGNLTAVDNCSGDITVSGVDSIDSSNPCNVIITRTWTFTDDCGNSSSVAHIITVTDTTAPVAPSAPADATFECIDEVPVAGNLTATDNCVGNITVGGNDSIDDSNPCNIIITRTWTFTDDCGNSSAVSQTITVTDTTAPVLISDLDTEISVSCAEVPDVPNLQFEDNCASNVNIDFSETNTFDESILMDYEIVRTWTVSDACGNSNVYTQTLQVSLDEVVTEIIGEDRCYDDGVIDLNDYLQTSNLTGVWEMIEGDTDAILKDNIFDPTVLELSLDFKPGTGGIDYLFKYTTTDAGCISITYVSMNINADCIVLPCGSEDVVISKAITPNGDQYNEYFEIGGVELCGFITEVKIFNRWGALVYESKDYQNNWNGTTTNAGIGNSGTLPNGTYYYIVILNNSGLNPFTGPVYIGTK